MAILGKEEAIAKLTELIGKDLRPLASKFGITVFTDEKQQQGRNKGWAGQVLERYIGLGASNIQAPNGGHWELKMVSMKKRRDGTITPKETMQITMINPEQVKDTSFENSHLLHKLKEVVICARLYNDINETKSALLSVGKFDLSDKALYAQVKKDYDLVRDALETKGFEALTGAMGVYIQPRTKGAGHGSTSRAFYARPIFIKKVLDI
ncbi:MAG: MutH/Sau3AI family endonuclease [Candidatus Omnitrophica bacterium]|nr:MutH/Sau3AI family endonuclease [Candidatus Omnitrophota bacterium]